MRRSSSLPAPSAPTSKAQASSSSGTGKLRSGLGAKTPSPLHRLLLAERTFRRIFAYELMRIFYYQPMFELQCASVGEGARLELTPDSKLPVIENCSLTLGARVRINARTTFQGARNAPGRPRIEIGDDTYL